MFKVLDGFLDSIVRRDPAARGRWEVALLYPGVHAIGLHRLAHWLWTHEAKFLGRAVAQFGRALTGIEIHPAARIGPHCFIDHGMGVVIGETAEIGAAVTLYHGVTLGGTTLDRGVKRHPTLGDGVIVGAGAQVLGPILVGAGARIGANAVAVRDVAPGMTVIGIPARAADLKTPEPPKADFGFLAYGTPCNGDRYDPLELGRRLDAAQAAIERLQAELAQLKTSDAAPRAPMAPGLNGIPIAPMPEIGTTHLPPG